MRDPSLLYHYLAVVSRIERLLTESKSAVLPLYETTISAIQAFTDKL